MTAAAARHVRCSTSHGQQHMELSDGKRLSVAAGLSVHVRVLNPLQRHREQLVVALMQQDGAAPTPRNERIRLMNDLRQHATTLAMRGITAHVRVLDASLDAQAWAADT